MQIIEISEPTHTSPIIANQDWGDEIAVGIDFGTTHSLVAYSTNGKAEIIDAMILPSILGINSTGEFVIGDQLDDNVISLHSVKRLIAKKIHELPEHIQDLCEAIDGEILLNIGGHKLTPVQIASKIIAYLKNHAELYFAPKGKSVTKAVITVPAYFDDNARLQIKYAAELAGFQVMRLIAEPTAAGYAYALDKKSEGKYLVFDFGGGTFDISLMNMQMGVFQVLNTVGDNNLGGDDIDKLIAQYLYQGNSALTQEHLLVARKLKEALSTQSQATIDGQSLDAKILKEISQPILDKLRKLTQQILSDAKQEEIKGIILAGGSTRLIPVQQMLKENFNIPLLNDIDPDKVVAYGAAIQAENLERRLDHILVDVTPLSIGLELMGGIVERIIERGTPIPASISKDFTTYQDGQQGLKLHVVQGEREAVELCRSLASFELSNIPDMPAGIPKITVTFTIDADGLLTVKAHEKITDTMQEIVVKPSYGLSESQVIEMLREAFTHSDEDHNLKLLRETTTQAEQVITQLQKRMQQFNHLLENGDEKKFNDIIEQIILCIKQQDREEIITYMKQLESGAQNFIARCFEFSAKEMLKGSKI